MSFQKHHETVSNRIATYLKLLWPKACRGLLPNYLHQKCSFHIHHVTIYKDRIIIKYTIKDKG